MLFFTSHLLELAYFADFIKRKFLGDLNRGDTQIYPPLPTLTAVTGTSFVHGFKTTLMWIHLNTEFKLRCTKEVSQSEPPLLESCRTFRQQVFLSALSPTCSRSQLCRTVPSQGRPGGGRRTKRISGSDRLWLTLARFLSLRSHPGMNSALWGWHE